MMINMYRSRLKDNIILYITQFKEEPDDGLVLPTKTSKQNHYINSQSSTLLVFKKNLMIKDRDYSKEETYEYV
jgi:hypothetical protein